MREWQKQKKKKNQFFQPSTKVWRVILWIKREVVTNCDGFYFFLSFFLFVMETKKNRNCLKYCVRRKNFWEATCQIFFPTNNFVDNHRLSIQIGCQTSKNMYAMCRYKFQLSFHFAHYRCWLGLCSSFPLFFRLDKLRHQLFLLASSP